MLPAAVYSLFNTFTIEIRLQMLEEGWWDAM